MATKTKSTAATLTELLDSNVRAIKVLDGANEHYVAITPIMQAFTIFTEKYGTFTMGLALTSEGTPRLTKGGRFSVWANFAAVQKELQFTVAGEKLHSDVLNLLGGDLTRNFIEEFGDRKEAQYQAFQLMLPALRATKVGKNKAHLEDPERLGFDLFR